MKAGLGRRVALAALAWLLLCGCFIFPSNNNEPSGSPFEYEGCTDTHEMFWAPSEDGLEVRFDRRSLDNPCNRVPFYSAGGGQGGEAYHFEPQLYFPGDTPPDGENYSVTFEYASVFQPDLVLAGQGFEVFTEALTIVPNGYLYDEALMFINGPDRGANVVVTATVTWTNLDGEEVTQTAKGAVYLVAEQDL